MPIAGTESDLKMGRKKKVLLLHVPYGNLYGGVDIRKLGFGIPPLGLIALSAYIRRETGCEVKLIDMLYHGVGIEDMPRMVKEFAPDIIGLSSSTPQMDNAYLLAKTIKECSPAVKIVMGGPHATALPQRTIEEEPSLDYVIAGEGEIPFASLVKGVPPESIKSLTWRNGGGITVNEREALIEDLAVLPFPDYESLPLDRYGTVYTGRSVGITGGRGCSYRCSFCASGITHLGRYRVRPVKIFLDDIERLIRLGAPRFDIWDDTFTSLETRVYEFTDGYRSRNLKARWTCETRADCINKRMLKEMRRAGMDILHIGCESGNQDVLNKVGKGIRLEQVRQACEWCREEGIASYVYFILGLPHDTKKTIKETIAFARSLPIDFAQFSMLVPLPGTGVWKLAQEGRVLKNLAGKWSDYDRYRNAVVCSDAVSARELSGLYRRALRSFYGRLSYIMKMVRSIDSVEKLKIYMRMLTVYFRA